MNALITAHGSAPAKKQGLNRGVYWWVPAGIAVLILLTLASTAVGVRDVSVEEILSAFSGSTETIGAAAVYQRIPRTVLAILVGASLAVAGVTMQAVTRNPIADPGILGVSGGASLAIVIGITTVGLSDQYSYMVFAIIGAALTSIFVYVVGSLGPGGATPLKLALAGAATTAACASLVGAIMLPRVDQLLAFQRWQVGGVGGADWNRISITSVALLLGFAICLVSARGMNTLALGDDVARSLGAKVGSVRGVSALGAIILVGAATAIAGPIGFVGLVIPHLCRLLVGTDHRVLIPFSAMCGAALLVAADVVGRLVARPQELEVGIVTAVIGAPFFIWIVRRQSVREL